MDRPLLPPRRGRGGRTSPGGTTAVVALGLILVFVGAAGAGPPTDELRGFFAAAGRVLDDPHFEGRPQEQLSAVCRLVNDIFDFREAARLALGRDWGTRTPREREQFVQLFTDVFQRSYIMGIASRIRLDAGVKIGYVDESIDGNSALVRTTIESKSGRELAFDYRMIRRGDRWAVRDVVIDGVSLVANYRAQFARVIHAESYPGLVKLMQVKVGESAVAETAAPATASPPPATEVILTAAAVESLRSERSTKDPPAPVQEKPEARRDTEDATLVAAAEATAVVSRAPAVTRWYWVQVGAFKNPEAARRLEALLREQRLPVWRRPTPASLAVYPVELLSKVRVGPFSDRAQASSTLRDLQGLGYNPFIGEGD